MKRRTWITFAIAQVFLLSIIVATEATDQNTADTFRTVMAEVLRKANPPKSNMSFKQCCAVCVLRNDTNIVIDSADKGKATVVMDGSN